MKKQFILIMLLVSTMFLDVDVYAKKYSTRRKSYTKKSYSTGSSTSKYSNSGTTKSFFSSGLSGKDTVKATSTTSKNSYDSYKTSKNTGTTSSNSSLGGSSKRTNYYSQRNYNPPRYYYGSPRSFGMWDSLFLWMMLDNIMTPSYSRFYYNHRSDPSVERFVSEARNQSKENEELKEKLDKMEGEVAKLETSGEKIDKNYLPDDIDKNYIYSDEYKKERKQDELDSLLKKALLFILVIGGLILLKRIAGMKKKLSPAPKRNRLPKNLEEGSYIEFDDMMFSNISYDSKFLLTSYKNIVKSVGTWENSGYGTTNVYLENEEGENIYLQVRVEEDRIKKAILFKNYDHIYPKTKEDWELWLGARSNYGLIGDDHFRIEDELSERLQDVFYKFSKRVDRGFNNYRGVFVEMTGDVFTTNLFEVMSRGDKKNYDDLLSRLMLDPYLKGLILGSKKENRSTVFKVKIDELEKECGVEYNSVSEGVVERVESCNSKTIERKGSLYSRYIDGEFFTEEYLSVEAVAEGDRAYIAIDIGIEVPVSMLESL